jgi:hypothetical protein
MQVPMTLRSSMFSATKKGRGAIAFVVVGHGANAALIDRQDGLRAIEGLELALLIDTHDQRLVRGAR